MVNIAVIGIGTWGKNHVRVCSEIKECNLVKICDLREDYLKELGDRFNVNTTKDYKEILADENIETVDICTPASTHYNLVKESLEAGKHVFVEKPLALNSKEAEELVKFAEKQKRVLMVGHLFRFHTGILKLKEEISKGTLGNIRFMQSTRVGLMIPKPDCGVIFDYALHDIDIFCFLLGQYPTKVRAFAGNYLERDFEDFGFLNFEYENDIKANAFVSWLMPEKIRELWVIGDKKSAKFDYGTQDIDLFGRAIENKEGLLNVKEGNKESLSFEKKEPLKEEIKHFIECVKTGKRPSVSGETAVSIVKIIEAVHKSIKEDKVIEVKLK